MAGTVGTLGVAIRADASGMAAGFGKAKRDVDQFTRSFSGAMNRTTSALTNVATHFSIVGKTGPEQLKQVANAGIGLASVFGPAGLLVSGIGLTGMTIVNWMTEARRQAKETEEAYKKLAVTFSMTARVDAVREFDADATRGGKLRQLEQQLEDKNAQLLRLQQRGVMEPAGLLQDITALQEKIAPLATKRKELVDLVEDEAHSTRRLGEATAQVAAREQARLTNARALTAEARRQAEEVERLFEIQRQHYANRVAVEQMATAATALKAPPVAGFEGAMRDVDAFAKHLTSEAGQAEQALNMVKAGAFSVSQAMNEGLRSAVVNLAQTMAMAAASIGASVAGGGRSAGIGSFLGGAIGGKLGEKLIGWSIKGVSLGGPIGAVVGSIAGGFIGKAVGGLVKGVGKLFGFGKKKGPSQEELLRRELERLAKISHDVGESLKNVPTGFKVGLDRFLAMHPSDPMRRYRPGGDWEDGARPAGPGNPRPPGKTEDRVATQAATMTFNAPITVVANDPREFYEKLERGRYTTDRGGVSHVQPRSVLA